ncbi:unnamed protein product [Cylicocyclus nassatus]|uniref:Uncharacterized protein n=1 Tax=Cylicocyclus nassatus TaxID=53992 RepID=A0AA36H2R7_CYLNA|nr:unnamed protein product [Cylicocyclus nassatus]
MATASERKALLAPSSAEAVNRNSLSAEDSHDKDFKEAFDELSLEGPKKSDGSEFKKGIKGWMMSIFYLLIIFICDAAISVLIMYLLLIQMRERPYYFGKGTHVGGTPHVVFEPNPTRYDVVTRGVIKFSPADPRTYQNLMIRYKKILREEYSPKKIANCSSIVGVLNGAPTNESVCSVESNSYEEFGDCALTRENIKRGMGFSRAEPCIMLRFSKVFGWFPSHSEDSDSRRCSSDGSCCNKKRISFSCSSSTLDLKLLPSDGMSTCAFPFWNKDGYEQPFVMLKLSNLTNGKHEVRCKPTLKSIERMDDDTQNVARIKFEVFS